MSIKNVTVIGGGVLGSQIAYQTAYAGFNVTVWLRSEASIERAKPKFERLHAIYISELNSAKEHPGAPVSRGLVFNETDPAKFELDQKIENAESAYQNIVFELDLAKAVADADLVIEALAEDVAQKNEFYAKLAPVLPEKTIVATNSSTLLPSMFAEATGRPAKYLALHFANNIWIGNTAEVMGHAGTDQAVFDEVVAFAEAIGMVALKVLKEQPGYILNSLLVPFLFAAEGLWANGVADIETIDKTWMLATGAPRGPFRILDVIGLTTPYNIVMMKPEAKEPGTSAYNIAQKLKEYIDAGKTGINAGEGFYKYK